MKLLNYIAQMSLKIQNLALKFISIFLWSFSKNIDYKKVLVYRIGNIGDISCSMDAFNSIRKAYPSSKLYLLTSPGYGADPIGLIEASRIFDQIFSYNIRDKKDFKNMLEIIKNLNINLFINLPSEKTTLLTQMRNAVYFKNLKIKHGYGFYVSTTKIFKKSQEKYGNFLNETKRLTGHLKHIKSDVFQFSDSLLKQYVDEDKFENINFNKLMLISHDCKAKTNKWKDENLIDIAKQWYDSGGRVGFIGGKSSRDSANEIINNANIKASNYCGIFELIESVYMIKKSEILVTMETGTVHLASLVSAKTITVSSSAYFKDKWKSSNNQNINLRKNISCSPCLNKVCKYKDNRCINSITSKEVWEIIKENIIEKGGY